MKPLRVGVIGYGYWGPNLARNFYEIPSAELVGIADLSEAQLKRAGSKYPDLLLTRDYHDLIREGLDAVVVATPPATHFEIAKDCLENNLNVLVEKPLTRSSEEAEELIQLAKDKGLTLMVGHTFTFNSAVHAVKKFIDDKELGDIYYIDAARLNLGLFQQSANVLWDLAVHDISILLFLLEKNPVSVSAQGTNCVIKDIYDVAYLNLTFPKNIMAHLHVSWLDPCKVRRVTVVGSKKMVVFNDVVTEEKIKIYDKGVEKPEYTNGFGDFQFSYRYGDIIIPNVRYAEPLRQECQHFLDSITNHSLPRSNGTDGLRVIKILEAAERSMKNGSTHEVLQW